MRPCVIDSSAWVSVVVPEDERGDRVLRELAEFDEWWVPDAFDLEVLYALRGRMLRGSMPVRDLLVQAEALSRVPVERMSTRFLGLRIAALSSSVSSYDAAFVAVAELIDAPLITTDARLARAPGPRCEFLLVEAN